MPIDFFVADAFFSFVSFFGHPFFWILVSAAFFWSGREKQSFFLMNVIVVSGVLVAGLKNFFKIERPLNNANSNGLLDDLVSFSFDKYSFPSGHATTIASVYGFFRKSLSKVFDFFFLTLVLVVGFSRIFLEKHFALDVAVGIVLGFAVGKLLSVFFEGFEKRKITKLVVTKELGLVVFTFLLVSVFFLFEELAATAIIIGYYFGVFLFKFLGFDSTNLQGRALILKLFFGFFGLGILGSVFLGFRGTFNGFDVVILFLSGFWISFLYPALYEKALKNKTSKK